MSIDTSLLKTWIRKNPEKCPSVKMVAVHQGLSPDYARREFHRKEGITLGQFVSDMRLEYVQKQLQTTEKTCFEIAGDLRLREDVLARWYKQRTGITMGEFRRKNGKPKPGGGGGQNLNDDSIMSEIANLFCKPALATVIGAKRVSSTSREGQSVVTAEFYWGTDMDFALLDTREKLDQMRGSLPREAARPTIMRIDPATEPVMTVALSAASFSGDLTPGPLSCQEWGVR